VIAEAQPAITRRRRRDRGAHATIRCASRAVARRRLGAVVPEGRCRLQAGARRPAKGARGAGRGAAPARRDRYPAQQAEAALAAAIADRDTARLNLGYTELRAPIDGTVGNRSARAGAYAAVGAQLICRWCRRSGLWVDANFKESQLATCGPGSRSRSRPTCCRATSSVPRACRQPGAGDRRAVQRAAAGERHRQLHQDRAARAGAHRCSTAMPRARPAAARPVGDRRGGPAGAVTRDEPPPRA
jgi:multidrug efflux pump subunit AcrA (membrane-fusion protein)